ncbi:MFS transporter small subunit [Verrucomicrobiota bacterium sgz303538]
MKTSNRVMLCFAWLIVGIPLTWGVYKSVEKSLPLFGVKIAATQPK